MHTGILSAILIFSAPFDHAELYEVVNAYREAQGLAQCVVDSRLEHAASLHVEWLGFSKSGRNKKGQYESFDHNTNTAWLLLFHPELDWYVLKAVYQDGLPDQLGAFDLAALCGFREGFCGDAGYFGSRPDVADVLSLWQRSPTHNAGISRTGNRYFGAAHGPVSGGNTAVFLFLAEPPAN